jgi:hypothetical protein
LRYAAGGFLDRRLGEHLTWELAHETKLVISVAIRTVEATGRPRCDVAAKPWRDDQRSERDSQTDQRASDDNKPLHVVRCCLHHSAGRLQPEGLAESTAPDAGAHPLLMYRWA